MLVWVYASTVTAGSIWVRQGVFPGSKLFTPVIDRAYPLDEIVIAHTYVDSGRKKGNVVITIQ